MPQLCFNLIQFPLHNLLGQCGTNRFDTDVPAMCRDAVYSAIDKKTIDTFVCG